MDADKLGDFSTIKTPHGDVKAVFSIFFLPRLATLYNEDLYNVLLNASLFLEP